VMAKESYGNIICHLAGPNHPQISRKVPPSGYYKVADDLHW
jgi:hypothetical protein